MTTPSPGDDALVEFYTYEYDESERLTRPNNRLEFERTRELLHRRLPPPPARILDVGGGTGAHAAWLAAEGYDVVLVDPVPGHVRRAQELSDTLTRGFSVRLGDARALDEEDAGVDACLMLGPLYHLPEKADRASALTEALRVTRTGGVVCASAISRCAWPLYLLRDGLSPSAERRAAIAAALETGDGDPIGSLPDCYSHSPKGLAAEFTDTGLTQVEVLGIEGPGWTLLAPGLDENRVQAMLETAIFAARLCEGQADATAASAHLLAVGQRPG